MSRKSLRNRPPQPPAAYPPPHATAEQLTFEAEAYVGPLPQAEQLAKYGEVLPDAPERIITMAEQEAIHRRSLERWIVKGDVIRSILGVIFAFLLGVGALGFGTYLVINGAPITGTIFAGAGLASLVYAFIYGTRARQKG